MPEGEQKIERDPEREEEAHLNAGIEEIAREIDRLAEAWEKSRGEGADEAVLENSARRISVLRAQLDAKKTILEALLETSEEE